MPYYAMIVVVESERERDAADLHPDELQFIGDLWEVKPVSVDEFDTASVLAQRAA